MHEFFWGFCHITDYSGRFATEEEAKRAKWLAGSVERAAGNKDVVI